MFLRGFYGLWFKGLSFFCVFVRFRHYECLGLRALVGY